jgi:hypothetical protein
MIMETIKLSLQDEDPGRLSTYLEKNSNKDAANNDTDTSERIKQLFSDFTALGLNPNEAATKAINQVANEQQEKKKRKKQIKGSIHQKNEKETDKMKIISVGKGSRKNVSETMVKYLSNVKKNPSAPKYRCFKISNKVFDKIASSEWGLELVHSVGFEIFSNELDFMCSIPLSSDLDAMLEAIEGTYA